MGKSGFYEQFFERLTSSGLWILGDAEFATLQSEG
jgi:hypothetical protein